jgi:hypothetical protein
MATLYNGVDAKDGGKENATMGTTMYAMTAPTKGKNTKLYNAIGRTTKL